MNKLWSGLHYNANRGSSLYLYVLIGYIFVAIGRTPEIITALLPLRLGMIFSVLMILLFANSLLNGILREYCQRFPQANLFRWLFIVSCLSAAFSSYKMLSLSFVFTVLIKLILFYFVITITIDSDRDIRQVIWGYIISILILGIPSLFHGSGGRFASLDKTYDPNDIALLMVVTLPIVMHFVPSNFGVKRLFLLFTLVVIVVATILSGSRGGFLGLVAVLTLMLVRSHLSLFKKMAVVGVVALTFIYIAPDSYRDRIFSIVEDKEEYNITDSFGRKQIWERAMVLFQRNPVFGVGPGAFQVANGFAFGESVSGVAWNATAHNSFVLIGTEMGATGLLLYVSILFVSVIKVQKLFITTKNEKLHNYRWLAKALEASIVGFMVSGFFLSSCYSPISYFLVGMSTVVIKLNARPSDEAVYIDGCRL